MDLDPDACYRAVQTRDARFDGRLFGAVKTTGIYCRPVCPARMPKRENLVFFPTAAAAEAAGFRACLRCRPETSPEHGAWRGASNTVARGLALIEAGALDEGGVDALAGRLGVGERQLRRLFLAHLGASPIQVAQTRRVLLAKQLIHETDLPMAQVALAAGFGSVRRFNETFQRLYARPPAALRRRPGGHEGKAHAVALMLRYRPPYDWDGLIGFLALRAIPGVETVTDGRYARAITVGGEAGTIAVEPASKDRLAVEVRFPRLSALPLILSRVRRVFDLSADPVLIGEHLGRDPALAPLVAARPGLRVPGAWDGFELSVRAVLGQQITVPAAVKLAGRLVAAYGEPLPEALRTEGLSLTFPRPERLAGADLSLLGMPGSRARALSAVAAAVAADPALFGPRRSLEEAVERLRALEGIGEWTAQYIAMRELREPDAFPAADVGLLRAFARAGAPRPSPAELLARAERWRPWRAYAALHLWRAGEGGALSAERPKMTAAPPDRQVPDSRVLRWRGVDGLSAEVLRFTAAADGFEAHSDLVDLDSPGFSVTYDWALDSGWRTRRLRLRVRAESERQLLIERAGEAAWTIDGQRRPDLDGCAEVDLQVTPFCNSLAIRQFGEGELTALYVPFPALGPVASRQRYDRLGRREYRYVDLGAHAGFQARLSLDEDGFVRRYEGVFEMIQDGDEP